MMNNVVLMFSLTDGKPPYKQGENLTVIRYGSVGSRAIDSS